ncbi:hypothetical protein VTI74DRAFT_1434 [Chaetomium olivicolor]
MSDRLTVTLVPSGTLLDGGSHTPRDGGYCVLTRYHRRGRILCLVESHSCRGREMASKHLSFCRSCLPIVVFFLRTRTVEAGLKQVYYMPGRADINERKHTLEPTHAREGDMALPSSLELGSVDTGWLAAMGRSVVIVRPVARRCCGRCSDCSWAPPRPGYGWRRWAQDKLTLVYNGMYLPCTRPGQLAPGTPAGLLCTACASDGNSMRDRRDSILNLF